MSLVLGLIAARPPTIILHPRKTRAGRANLPRTNAARVSDAFHLCLCGPCRTFKRDYMIWNEWAVSIASSMKLPICIRSCVVVVMAAPGSWGTLPPSQYESRYRRRIFTRLSRFFMQPSDTPHTPKLSTGFKH